MRICVKISGELIEAQSDATAGTLLKNALAAGYLAGDIEEREISAQEWMAMLDSQRPAPTYRELRAAKYPPFQDYLDGVVKGDQAQIQRYVDACLAVKAAYPKMAG